MGDACSFDRIEKTRPWLYELADPAATQRRASSIAIAICEAGDEAAAVRLRDAVTVALVHIATLALLIAGIHAVCIAQASVRLTVDSMDASGGAQPNASAGALGIITTSD